MNAIEFIVMIGSAVIVAWVGILTCVVWNIAAALNRAADLLDSTKETDRPQ